MERILYLYLPTTTTGAVDREIFHLHLHSSDYITSAGRDADVHAAENFRNAEAKISFKSPSEVFLKSP